MSEKLTDKKIGKLTLIDGALIGTSKLGSEMLIGMIPYVGNGNWRSGSVKVVGAVLGSMATKNNKSLQIITTGILIDGMEDLVLSAKKYITGKMGKGQQNATAEVAAFA